MNDYRQKIVDVVDGSHPLSTIHLLSQIVLGKNQNLVTMHTTNYTNTFIEIADDCKAETGKVPPEKTEKSVAQMQFEMIANHPYRYTSDEVIFAVFAARNQVAETELETKQTEFFSKGQPCLRASPLGKTYGWGIHYDHESKMALYAVGSTEYERLKNDNSLKHLKAMKSAR